MIYLDNAATTKPNENALTIANEINTAIYFNPSARYKGGIKAKNVVDTARDSFKKVFGSNFDVIFTSCGSESDNTAIFSYTKRGNAVTTLGEHSAVYEPFMALKNSGYDARFSKILKDGSVDVKDLLSKIDNNTTFVSVVHVNNETGAINDINAIAKQVKKINPRIVFHSDGVQAFGKIKVNLSSDIDLYSVSAHKIGGLKGVGLLLKNKKLNNLKPLILGGGQEFALRSGTENVFGIRVFELATLDKTQNLNDNYTKVQNLKKSFIDKLDKDIFTIISGENSSPYVLSLSASGLRGEVLQHMLEEDDIYIGTGSACSSKHPHSRVLTSAGYTPKMLDGVVRISFSSDNTLEEIEYAVSKLNEKALKLKKAMIVWIK